MKDRKTIALVGNPNCGKTTLFNALTGARQKVGNWPGVTVERKTGELKHADRQIQAVDLPGIYSLHASREEDSIDYQIAQHYILTNKPDLLLNIIDAASIERGLYLTTQLLDANMPMVVVLNMVDVANQQGMLIDAHILSQAIGCPVIPIVASRNEGLDTLLHVIENTFQNPLTPAPAIELPDVIQKSLVAIENILLHNGKQSSRLITTAVLEQDTAVISQFDEEVRLQLIAISDKLAATTPVSEQLITARYQWIDQVTEKAIRRVTKNTHQLTEFLDGIFLNKWLAFPVFLAMNYLMFMFTIHIGSAFIDVFDMVTGAIFIEIPKQLLQSIGTPAWITNIIADGLGGGIQLVANFIPIIACLFLFLAVLEDSGYMTRAAFIIDRLLRGVGLPGKSFVPLIIGFGCNVPSVLAARTLTSEQDRILTILMAPYMSCGARLTVYALFAAAFFPVGGQNIIFALYVIGIILAVLTGLVVRKFVFTSEQSPFILELPPYHMPTLRGIMIQTWHRLRGFVMRAGKAIVIVVVVLNFVNAIGTDGSFGHENSEKSLLSEIGKTITPIFKPMGIKEENWPATVGIFTGLFAKEVVVGTLDALYGDIANAQNGVIEKPPFEFWPTINAAFATIPQNLSKITDALSDPLGISIGDVSNLQIAAQNQEVQVTTLTIMSQLFDGKLAAFAYLLFILLYFPCVATVSAIDKEAGRGWAIFSGLWSLTLAYSCAVIVYQTGQLGSNTASAISWILAMIFISYACYTALLRYAKNQAKKSGLIPVINL